MTKQKNGVWSAIVTLSVGVILGVGGSSWMTNPSTIQETKSHEETRHDRQLAQLEKAVTDLTHSLQSNNVKGSLSETCAASQSHADVLQQSVAQIVHEELRQALANGSPESQRARAEEIAIAQALTSPENRTAYQSVSDVVHAVLGAGRLTDNDAQALRDAFVELTNEQKMEVMRTLVPAINQGTIVVETSGPLF
jgi:hypothetical protein